MYNINELKEKIGNQSRAERLAFIDFKVRFSGKILRSEIVEEFGISEPLATKDLSEYKQLTNDKNIVPKTHQIRLDTYQPLVEIEARKALEMHFEGFCRHKLQQKESAIYKIACDLTAELDAESIAVITRAITDNKRVRGDYISANSDYRDERILEPSTVFFDGLNWVFRAKDIKDNSTESIFKSFHFSRFERIEPTEDTSESTVNDDNEWNTLIPIQLGLHPDLDEKGKQAIRIEFGMGDTDTLVVVEKSVFAWSLLERWSVDSGTVPSEIPPEASRFKFYLKNADMLQHVNSVKRMMHEYTIKTEGYIRK
ncbi:WYL domain-containing protein [Vibrio coralliirubri]|uniref:WYL domain-containing protein n=1 Tax=Vibrio coralliirubri TaxID=1516159 RepID=UPI002FCE8B18